jgi:cytochrome c556
MVKIRTVALALAGVVFTAGAVQAHDATDPAVKARQSLMGLYAYNLGTLGAMAQGKMPYDAQMATVASGNLAKLSKIDMSAMWPAGSDADHVEGSHALPVLWDSFPDVISKAQALSSATDAMAEAAGTDLEALQAAMGPLGGACGACHKSYRAPH